MAKMVDYETIRVAIFSSITKGDNVPIILYDNKGMIEKLNIANQSFLNGLVVYECRTKNKLTLGVDYSVGIESFGMVPLNVNDMVFKDDFDDLYYYDGDDLGATYSKKQTTFKVWAPLASKVVLMIRKGEETFQTYKMNREDKGVYTLTLKGDYDGYKYRYQVTNSGTTNNVIDPYGKGSDANGRHSVVIDLNKTKINLYKDVPQVCKNYVDATIYELHVRDFTINPCTSIKNKGKFLGLIEEGIKTPNGNPVGFDYLKSLNITHVQILPVLDYKTVDELDTDKKYNWGYDPQQYFSLEGSYSTDPNDAYSRIIEFKKVVQAFHKAGLKINLDVVYNHVYDYQLSNFERLVPNYYFRRYKNGLISNGTGCGNDLASERKMVRKMIIDSLCYLLKEFEIDGYRFDLLGITDIETMKLAEKKLREIDPYVMLYGEGWDMATELPSNKKCTIYNSFQTPTIGFFNDFFRDTLRGSNFGGASGYLLGNTGLKNAFKFAMSGSVLEMDYFKPRFINPNQSINYVECHDNCTLFDKIEDYCGKNLPLKDKLQIVNLVNGTIACSVGVPFYHAGQEIGQTKYHQDNTYNMGDKYNMFRWDLLDEREENYKYFKSILSYRLSIRDRKLTTTEEVKKKVRFFDFDNVALFAEKVELDDGKYKECIFAINPTNTTAYVELPDYYKYIIGIAGELKGDAVYGKNIILENHCLNVFIKER